MKIAIDQIEQRYQSAYDQAFGENNILRKLKEKFKHSDRAYEIQFLKTISDHPESNDAIRHQAMTLVHNKIIAKEVFGKTSRLRDILNKFIVNGFRELTDEENDLNHFLEQNDDVKMPAHLQKYFEKNKEQFNHHNDSKTATI